MSPIKKKPGKHNGSVLPRLIDSETGSEAPPPLSPPYIYLAGEDNRGRFKAPPTGLSPSLCAAEKNLAPLPYIAEDIRKFKPNPRSP